MKWEKKVFSELFLAPTKNGLYKSKEFHGTGTKIINMGEIFAYGIFDNYETQRIEVADEEKSNYGLLDGDLLFARRSLVESGAGKVTIIKEPNEDIVFESSIIRVRLDKGKTYPLFYYYWMKSLQGRTAINAIVSGTNVKGIRSSELSRIEVDFPCLEVQRRIASVLSAYDDLIENNKKQIKLLEEAAQRLYKEWFVDLRFPGREDVEIVDGLPKGWGKVSLEKVAPIVTGKKDANFGTEDGAYLFFTCSQEPLKAPEYSFNSASVILAGNGDFNVKLYRGKFEAYQRTYVFTPYVEGNLFVLYYAIKDNMRQLFQGASGSTIRFLTKGMLEHIAVCIPDGKTLENFNILCFAIQGKIEKLQVQIDLAKEVRDRLLPKLMSGEVEV